MLLGYQSRPASSWCPSAQEAGCPIPAVREGSPSPPTSADGGPEKGLGTCLPDGRCLSRSPSGARPLAHPFAGSLQTGQHRAPSQPPPVHHAPGGLAAAAAAGGHQLCLRSPPRFLQLLRQLHEPRRPLSNHMNPVSNGLSPQVGASPLSRVRGARGLPAHPARVQGDAGGSLLGKKPLVSATPLAVGQLERVCVGGRVVGVGSSHLHLSFCEPFTPGLSSASPG